MTALSEHLAKQYEAHSSNTHFNIDILKYELRPENCMHASPLAVSYRWQQQPSGNENEPKSASLHLVVRHRGVSLCPVSLKNPQVSFKMEGIDSINSTPPSTFDQEKGKVSWRLPELTSSSADYVANADVKFKEAADVAQPQSISHLNVTFDGEGHLFSGLKFDLVSIAHYRMSVFRKQFKSGRYDVEPDGPSQLAYV